MRMSSWIITDATTVDGSSIDIAIEDGRISRASRRPDRSIRRPFPESQRYDAGDGS